MSLNDAHQNRDRPSDADVKPDSAPLPPDGDDGDTYHPDVPVGVLRGIEDITEGRTASMDNLEPLLRY